ncbi:MAG: hypothetical protein ACTHMY_01660 [Solirubrobacteraceae bacterium]
MGPDDLAARSIERAAGNDGAVLAVLAAAGDEGVRPGRELAERARLPDRTVREVLGRLEAKGLARRDGKRRAWATNAGRSQAGADTPGLSLAPTLDVALACLPAEALRAFARLTLSAIPARWHLASTYPTGWAGLIAMGPTKTGKTSIATLACRVYGVDELAAIRVLQHETPGALFGRRTRAGAGYRVERSRLLDLPFVCVDELDKASRELQAVAGGLLLGNAATTLEGERVEIRPTVYVTLNTGRAGLGALQAAHVRRSVVLDTAPLRQLLADVDEGIARLFTGHVAIPRLTLARTRPPAPALPDELRKLLRADLRAGLTEEGWQHVDVEPLARLALGRAAITGGELEQATVATVLDYLTCAATIGQAQPGFASQLATRLGGHGALAPDPEAAEEELEHPHKRQRELEHQAAATRLEFVHARSRAAATVIAARDAMGRSRDIERKAIADALSEAAERIRGARNKHALDAAVHAAIPYVEEAQAWAATQASAAAATQRRADEQRRQRELQRAGRSRERQPTATPSQPAPIPPLDRLAALTALAPITATPRPTAQPVRHPRRQQAGLCPGCGTVYPTVEMVCGKCDRRLQPVA